MNFKRLSLKLLCLGLVATFILSACGSAAPTSNTELPPLRIGTNKWVGWGALYIAKEKGFFEKEGVKVELVPYDTYDAANVDFASKKLDGNASVLSDTIAQTAAHIAAKVVWVFDSSQGADVLVGNSSITSPADLRGKRIGMSYGTFGHVFVLSGLAKFGISRSDVTLINIAAEDVPQALAEGKIDAGHTWEPYLSTALKNGGKTLFTSADTPGMINDVLTFQSNTLEKRPDDVKAVIRAILDGADYWTKNPEESNQIIGKAIDIPPADIPSLLSTDHILSLAEVQEALSPNSTLFQAVNTIAEFFAKEKVIEQAPEAASILNATFAQAMASR